MMKKINLVATKHITIEKFFLPLIHSYINNDFELTIICNHSDKIKKILDKKYKSQINYLDFSLPVTIISLINPYLFFLKIIQIHRYLKKNDVKIIHINTPIASHFFRIANIFLKNKIIYHVHGFRFHKKGNFFKNQFNFLIEYFLSFKTDVYIAINNEDYNIINKFFKRKSFLIQGLGINLENINKYLSLKKNNFDKKINIGVIGAYKIEKGYKDIIDLAKILIKDKNIIINCYGYEALTLTTNENGTNGPQIQLMHNTASPAAGDYIGQLRFSGKDSAGNTDLYSKIDTVIDDPTSGQETAHLQFSTRGYSSFNPILRLKNRGTASAPSYTADDINGIILDVYNTGNPYPRYMNFIAKAGGNTDSNIGFWTEAVGGSPTEKLRIASTGELGLGLTGADVAGATSYIAEGGINLKPMIYDLVFFWITANLILGAFNMLPFGPLDGAKIKDWNEGVWFAFFSLFIGLTLLMLTGTWNAISISVSIAGLF